MDPWDRAWIDYYAELGLAPTATERVIQAAYRALAKEFHPDHGGDPDGERMKRINVAHEILIDPTRRAHYDARYRERADRREQFKAESERPGTTTPGSTTSPTPDPAPKATGNRWPSHRRTSAIVGFALIAILVLTIIHFRSGASGSSGDPFSLGVAPKKVKNTAPMIKSTAGQSAAPTGYLGADASTIYFIQSTSADRLTDGQVYIANLDTRQGHFSTTTGTFSSSESGPSLTLTTSLGFTLSGTLQARKLTAVIPTKAGTPETLDFQSASANDYQSLVEDLNEEIETLARSSRDEGSILTAIQNGLPPSNLPYAIDKGSVTCIFALGATGYYWGLRANYLCKDGTWLYGVPSFSKRLGRSIFGTTVVVPAGISLSQYQVTGIGGVQLGDPRCSGLSVAQDGNCYQRLTTPTTTLTRCSQGALGISYSTMVNPVGIEIDSVQPESSAATAGLQSGDVITQIGDDGFGENDFSSLMFKYGPGSKVRIIYERYGAELTTILTVAGQEGCS